jgi:integrase
MVPLGAETVEHLRTVPQLGPWVVPGRERDRPREDLKGPWEAIRETAKIGDVTIHDIRRTFGVHVAKTAGLHVASKLLRHSDVRVTERVYVPLGLDALREALTATHAQRGKVLRMHRKSKRA